MVIVFGSDRPYEPLPATQGLRRSLWVATNILALVECHLAKLRGML